MSEKGNAMSTIFIHILLNVMPPLNRVLEAVTEFRIGKYLHKLVQFLFDVRKVRTKKKRAFSNTSIKHLFTKYALYDTCQEPGQIWVLGILRWVTSGSCSQEFSPHQEKYMQTKQILGVW